MAEPVPEEPPFMKSLNEIGSFCTAFQSFKRIFDDLHRHIDSTRKAIDTHFNNLPSHQQQLLLHQTDFQDMQLQSLPIAMRESQPSRLSEFHDLCKTMCSRGLRKFLVSHLSDADSLHREATAALKSAPEPAKLVLECVGRFFLQGSKAYTKDSPMITSRQASVLILELFLRLIGEGEVEIVIEDSIDREASAASAAWRNRIQSEGGPLKVCEIDARGLLLFVACFGIPDVFKDEDIRDLIRATNMSAIGCLLKRSPMLAPKIPDIIENMKKNGMHIEAVDVAFTFGIEDKFSPQTILTAFIQESKEEWNRSRRNTPVMQKKACKKHLAALKSVIKCLENRNIDPVKLLPGFEIKENIVKLEKEISNLNKQIMDTNKRKADGIESSNKFSSQEAKRSRFTAQESFLMTSPSVISLNDARAAANYAIGKSSYDGLIPNLLDRGASSQVQSYPAASAAILGYGARTALDVLSTTLGGGGSLPGVGIDVSVSTGVGIRPTGSYPGVHRDMALDNVGQTVYGNALAYRWNRVGEGTAYSDRFTAQSVVGNPPDTKVDALLRQSLSIDCVAGQPDPQPIGVSNRNSSSDLYGFADAIV